MIRDATESELPCLAAAMLRLQEAHVTAYPDVYRTFGLDDALAHLSELLLQPNVHLRVAVDNDTVVGHAIFVVEARPETMFTHSQRYGKIEQIEVEPDCRRKGYGGLLLADCEQIAKSNDLPRIVLEVWSFNDSAKAFYKSLGYKEFGLKLLRCI